ncbi:MAG: hypothetical protein AB1698_10230 [Pseudomonadota bacterium]
MRLSTRLIAPLAGLLLAASGLSALAQTPPAAPAAPAAPAPNQGMTQAGTPARPEVQIARPIEMLLTQQAASMTFDGKTLTLTGVPPVTSFRVERPERIGGTMTTEQFVKLWNATVAIFKNDPPNAALTVLGPTPTQVIIELGSVTQNGTTLTYNATLLDGDIPSAGGPVNLVTAPVVYRPLEATGTFLKCWWSPYWVERVCRAGW